jgi:hypothetical protein
MQGIKLAITLILLSSSALAQSNPDTQELAKVADGFYGAYMTLHPSDGIPDKVTRAKFAPFVSPALNALFVEGNATEERYAKANKNQAPPIVEGDPFTPNFEGATSYKLGACTADARGGHCAVTLTYDDKKDKPLVWTDTVYLVHTPQGWRVDDIAYGGSGKGGRLTQTLTHAIAEGNAFSK